MSQRPLDETFDRFLMSKIFKNRDVMRPTYVPDELPHREDQITRIGMILASALKGGTPSNIFLYGKTGTGKTAVAKYVIDKLVEKSKALNLEIPVVSAYVNCRITDTNYRVLAKLADEVGAEVPFTGLPTDEVYYRFKKKLDTRKQLMLIVLDEIDILVKKNGTNILYNLTRMNSNLKSARISIIGITNDLKLKDYLDPRVLSSLSEEEVVFSPYTALQLQDILRQRARMAFNDGVLEYGVINLCSAIAAREHGDARRAIDLLRVAGEIAEREGAEKVTEEHVRRSIKEIERDTVSEALSTLPIQSKLVLLSIYLLESKGRSEIFTGEVYSVYSELTNLVNVETLTLRRVSDLISELDMLGVVNVKIISKGRYGRTKRISLSVSKAQINEIFKEDHRLKKILNYTPRIVK
ncbi:MAG: ORC1-type DNA replication protein [Candidatus Odinarchaeia archaeon]